MRILFTGIYELGDAALRALESAGTNIVGVVTKPSPEGDRQTAASWAASRRVPLFEPVSPRAPWFLEEVERLRPDLIAVAGYHRVFPASILAVPTWGTVNLHGSLLPRYRGPSPWKQAILDGETRTGVTVHVMTPELDSGDILSQAEIEIEEDDTGGSLFRKICSAGAQLLPQTIADIAAGRVARTPQDARLATYFGYPNEEQTSVNWSADAYGIRNLVRAMCPRPGAWTPFRGRRLRIWQVSRLNQPSDSEPGTILEVSAERFAVATGTDSLVVEQSSLEQDGQPVSTWLAGPFRPQAGERLGCGGSSGLAACS